jgi:ABC-type transporter Mla subunit MlaD
MRKLVVALSLGVPLYFFLSVWATPLAAPTWTVNLRNSRGLQTGDLIEEAGQPIGHVVRVDARSTPVHIVMTLDPDARDRLRERATLFVITPTGASRPVLRLVVFDKYSPPLPSGSVIAGAESEIEVELRRQLATMESTVQTFTQQVETFNRALDQTQRSEEKRQLEDSVGNLLETLQQTRDEMTQSLSEEVDRWKKLYEQLVPASPAKP